MEDAICRVCNEEVCLRAGQSHTGICDQCAQNVLPGLMKAAEGMLADVRQYIERGGSLTEREQKNVIALQDAVAKTQGE